MRWYIQTTICILAGALLYPADTARAATWTKLTNAAPDPALTMLQLTDGTIMVEGQSGANWMRLTPDIHGSYVNGIWTANPINPMNLPRYSFASQVLPDGRVWVLGGEGSGPGLSLNWTARGEIYDPILNSWSPIAPYPSQPDCPALSSTTGNTTIGSAVITGILDTTNFKTGWTVTGYMIPGGSTITSIDSSTQIHISQNATATNTAVVLTFNGSFQPTACFGDDPTILLPGGKILAGNLVNQSTYIYDIATNTWAPAASKVYPDFSDEEGWVKLADGSILTYDLLPSVNAGSGYAERYNPTTNVWSGIGPGDGTSHGVLPLLSSYIVGLELGPILRLQDGRIFILGANGHTALYTPTTNTWAAGPDIMGTLAGSPFLFGADDAPAAVMPNGHVLFAADTGSGVTSTGSTIVDSAIITGIPSTAQLQKFWYVTGTGIPYHTLITSIDSPTQIHISQSATATNTGINLTFNSIFWPPTQIFDFNPASDAIALVSPAIPDTLLTSTAASGMRMLVLPTGQVLFEDFSQQLWVYTPDGPVNPALRPAINQIAYNGGGIFTLTGTQLNGQGAGAAFGDDAQMDENYPIVRLTNSSGNVYYARTTNWSSVGVATGTLPETVNFTLNPAITPGNYSVVVSGAGISSNPIFLHITQSEVAGQ